MTSRPMVADVALLTGICLVVAAGASVLVGGLNNVAVGVWMIVLSLGLLVASGRSAVSLGNTLGVPYWFSHDMQAAEQEHRAALRSGPDPRRRRAKAFALASLPVAVIGVLLAAV